MTPGEVGPRRPPGSTSGGEMTHEAGEVRQ
jgi:hypothetical protein